MTGNFPVKFMPSHWYLPISAVRDRWYLPIYAVRACVGAAVTRFEKGINGDFEPTITPLKEPAVKSLALTMKMAVS